MATASSDFGSPINESPLSQGGRFVTGMLAFSSHQVTDPGVALYINGTVYSHSRWVTVAENATFGVDFTSDQYAKITILNPNTTGHNYAGPSIRNQTGASDASCYWINCEQLTDWVLNHIDVDTTTVTESSALKTYAVTPVDGQVGEIRVTGSNPVVIGAIIGGSTQSDYSDTTYLETGGQPGFGSFQTGSSLRLDNWEGGDIVSAAGHPAGRRLGLVEFSPRVIGIEGVKVH